MIVRTGEREREKERERSHHREWMMRNIDNTKEP